MRCLLLVVCVAAAVSASALPPLGDALSFGGNAETDLFDREYIELEVEIDETDTVTDSTDEVSSLNTEETEDSTTSETDTTDTTTTEKPPPYTDDSLSGGAIAGIVIGSIAGVALIAGLIYFMKKKEMLCFG